MAQRVKCCILLMVMASIVCPAFADRACITKILKEKLVDFGAAFNSSDSKGFSKLFTEDARLLRSNVPIVIGRENVVAALTARAGDIPKTVVTNQATMVYGNKVAVQQNSFVLVDEHDNILRAGKGINVWRREDDLWKLHWLASTFDDPCPCP